MNAHREVKLFRIGRHQAVRIPRAFELPGDVADMHHDGRWLTIEAPRRSLLDMLATMSPIDDEFAGIDDLVADPAGS